MRRLFIVAMLVSTAGFARADDTACVNAAEKSLALRKQGKLQDALKELATCADPACPQEVKDECTQRVAQVDAAIPSIVLGAKDGAGADLESVVATMDGQPFLTKLDGRAIRLDPGEHVLRLTTPNGDHVERTIVVREGEKERRETFTIGAVVAPPSKPSFWTSGRAIATATTGVGIVGIGLGAWFGAFALSSQSQEHGDCSSPNCRKYLQSVADYNTAETDALASTLSFIAGGVLAATGVILWLTIGRVHVMPTATAHGMGLTFEGAFF